MALLFLFDNLLTSTSCSSILNPEFLQASFALFKTFKKFLQSLYSKTFESSLAYQYSLSCSSIC